MQCANPVCQVESLYFRSGSLHTIDRFDRSGVRGRESGMLFGFAQSARRASL